MAGRRRVADEIPNWRPGLSGVGRLVYLDLGRTDGLQGNEQLHDPWTYLQAAAESE